MKFNRALRATIVCSLLLALTSCRIPDLRKGKCGPSQPPDFNGVINSENSACIGTHEFFDDPLLLALIDQGLTGNQELRKLAENIQIANAEIRGRRGLLFPFVEIGGRAGLEKRSLFTPLGAADDQLTFPGGGNFPDPVPNFLTAADISWQIDIWRQLRNSRDAAVLRFYGTRDGVNYVVTRLVAEIAENYYMLLALDQQLETLNNTIQIQEQSIEIAKARKEAARDNELPVQRFVAEVRKNQSEKFIIAQQIVETENRINFLVGRYPQHVDRASADFLDLKLPALSLGAPAQLLRNRADIRQAERELSAAGLDIRVARANFFPKLVLTAGVGYEAFNTRYLFISPESLIYNTAGNLVAPLINKSAIRAEYMTANAKQLQALYEYQRVCLNAFTEVINNVTKVENYSRSIQIKKRQLEALNTAVSVSGQLFQNARVEYIDVLFAQRDRNEARMNLIEAKKEQLSAIVYTYQALGGGMRRYEFPPAALIQPVDPAQELDGAEPPREDLPPPPDKGPAPANKPEEPKAEPAKAGA